MDISKLKAGDEIYYSGKSNGYEGEYTVVPIEDTYYDPDKVPPEDRGKLAIVHLTNGDLVIFMKLEELDPKEWGLIER